MSNGYAIYFILLTPDRVKRKNDCGILQKIFAFLDGNRLRTLRSRLLVACKVAILPLTDRFGLAKME